MNKDMNRITRRIGNTIALVDGRGFGFLNHEETIKLLFNRLAECEDRLDENNAIDACFSLEEWFNSDGKSKPIEMKAAMYWGALCVARQQGDIDWDTQRLLFGEFMSNQMNLK